MKSIQEQITDWAEKHVPTFNKLSEQYKTPYYTQSPLNEINQPIDLMVIGINPKGDLGSGAQNKNADAYKQGNPFWEKRFNEEGKNC